MSTAIRIAITVLTTVVMMLATLSAPTVVHADLPYDTPYSPIVWDSYLMSTTERRPTQLRVGLTTIFDGTVTGLSDDNLPLMTSFAEQVIRESQLKRARMVVPFGTSTTDRQTVLWMQKARSLRLSSLIAIRFTCGAGGAATQQPSGRAYMVWLKRFLRAFPQVSAVEPVNEPNVTCVTASRAAVYYRRARSGLRRHRILAGSFADVPRAQDRVYVREYVKLLGGQANSALWAFHFYQNVIYSRPRDVDFFFRVTGAQRVWVTETGAFVALGREARNAPGTRIGPDVEHYNLQQQLRQLQRIRAIAVRPEVEEVFWTGGEACHGCHE